MRAANRTWMWILALVLLVAITATGQGRTALDGVYSEDQAKRGETAYVNKCSECHDDGIMGPELLGSEFVADWRNKSLGDLYRRILTTMPADNPGSLKPDAAIDLVAYVLQLNGFPATEEPVEDGAELEAIKFGAPR